MSDDEELARGLRRAGDGIGPYPGTVDAAVTAGRRRRWRARGVATGVITLIAGVGLAVGLNVAGGDDEAGLDVVTPPTSSVPGTVVIITTTTTTTPAPTAPPGPTSSAPPTIATTPPPVLLADGDTVVRWTPTTSEVVIEDDGAITAAFDDLAGGHVIGTTDDRGVELVRWYPAGAEPITLREASVHQVVSIDGEPTAIITRQDGEAWLLEELTLATSSARAVTTLETEISDAAWDGTRYVLVTEPDLGCGALRAVQRSGEASPVSPGGEECVAVSTVGPMAGGAFGTWILLHTPDGILDLLVTEDAIGGGSRALSSRPDSITDIDRTGDWSLIAAGREVPTSLLSPDGASYELPPAIGVSFARSELRLWPVETIARNGAQCPVGAPDRDGVHHCRPGDAPVVAGDIVDGANARFLGGDGWSVEVQLTAEASAVFDELAALCLAGANAPCEAGRIAIEVDGEVVSAPTVQTPTFDGAISITGGLTEAQAVDLAERLAPRE